MFQYFGFLIMTAVRWVWDFARGSIVVNGQTVNTTFYGVSLFQIGVVIILVTLFFRAFIIPTLGGQGFHAGLFASHSNINGAKRAVERGNKLNEKWEKSERMKFDKL